MMVQLRCYSDLQLYYLTPLTIWCFGFRGTRMAVSKESRFSLILGFQSKHQCLDSVVLTPEPIQFPFTFYILGGSS